MGEGSVLPLEKVIIDQGSPSDAATPGGRSGGTGDSPAQGISLQITCWFSWEEASGQRTELGLLLQPCAQAQHWGPPHAAPPE